ncbi:MAG: hypothetical protein ACU0CI_03985 [Shimia sp.]
MSGDPVQQLIEEITALRRSVEHLARTSLDKDEAKTLNETLTRSIDRMASAAQGAPQALRAALEADRIQTAQKAIEAAERAAGRAVKVSRSELEAERDSYVQALSDARRAARRAKLTSWPIVTILLATGALLGVLTAYGTETAKSVLSVKDTIRVACEYPLLVGGQRVPQDSGWTFCAVPIEGPNGERP